MGYTVMCMKDPTAGDTLSHLDKGSSKRMLRMERSKPEPRAPTSLLHFHIGLKTTS